MQITIVPIDHYSQVPVLDYHSPFTIRNHHYPLLTLCWQFLPIIKHDQPPQPPQPSLANILNHNQPPQPSATPHMLLRMLRRKVHAQEFLARNPELLRGHSGSAIGASPSAFGEKNGWKSQQELRSRFNGLLRLITFVHVNQPFLVNLPAVNDGINGLPTRIV